jgi:hypothetical protein
MSDASMTGDLVIGGATGGGALVLLIRYGGVALIEYFRGRRNGNTNGIKPVCKQKFDEEEKAFVRIERALVKIDDTQASISEKVTGIRERMSAIEAVRFRRS